MKSKVSICIPTYEMKGKGAEYLKLSFIKLTNQTFKDFEVVVSDHSLNTEVFDLCSKFSSLLNIKYLKNENKRGKSSANINNAIKKSSGDLIKILFQDDFLYDEVSLESQVSSFDQNWLVTACCHYDGVSYFRPFYPKYNHQIQYGNNTISSPSVLMFKNEDVLFFDENLVWLMDVDYYKRLYDKYGEPSICNRVNVVNRQHPDQLTNVLSNEIKNWEHDYIIKKYCV